MGVDWTKYAPLEFREEEFLELLRGWGEGRRGEDCAEGCEQRENEGDCLRGEAECGYGREEFWREFLRLLEMGTSSVRGEEERWRVYRAAYEFIAQPEHWRDCLLVKEDGVRMGVVRRFPFLGFRESENILRKIRCKVERRRY